MDKFLGDDAVVSVGGFPFYYLFVFFFFWFVCRFANTINR